MKLKKILQVFGLITVILTLLPILDLDYWFIRMLDFPHVQLTILTLTSLLLFFIKFEAKDYRDYLFIITLLSCFFLQGYKIYPYTPIAKLELLNSSENYDTSLTLFTANLLQENENSKKIIAEVEKIDADVLLFTETNKRWQNEIKKAISSKYSYTKGIALDNTYGMLLYSKYKLENTKINYLVDDSIPSIEAKLILPNQDKIQILAIHPTPPMPSENPKSTDRDTELMLIAKRAKNSNIPVIVMGDFNDVAWSHTSNLFSKVSGLLDARKGRGFYNTYNAKKHLIRWPLDHIYVSSEFRLKSMKSCEAIDSDHFPLFMELSYEPKKASEQEKPSASKQDLEEANQQIKRFKNKNN